MGRSGKKQRLYDMYMDDIEDDVFFYNTLINQQSIPKTYNKSQLVRSSVQSNNKVHIGIPPKINNLMTPRNSVQDAYIKNINNDETSIVLATGPAGTGKSCIAVSAAIDLFTKGKYERIVITRPAVTVDEDHGFLPGKIEDKLDEL